MINNTTFNRILINILLIIGIFIFILHFSGNYERCYVYNVTETLNENNSPRYRADFTIVYGDKSIYHKIQAPITDALKTEYDANEDLIVSEYIRKVRYEKLLKFFKMLFIIILSIIIISDFINWENSFKQK